MDGARKSTSLDGSNLADPAADEETSQRSFPFSFLKGKALNGEIFALLVRRRKRIVILALLAAVLVEAGEHIVTLRWGEMGHTIYDVIFFIILIPLLAWTLVSLFETAASERERIALDSTLRTEFSQKLGEAATWDDLVRRIVEYSHQVAPESMATLFTFNPDTLRMDPEAAAKRDGSVVIKPPLSINPDTLPVGSLPQLLLQSSGGQGIPRSTLVNVPPSHCPPTVMISSSRAMTSCWA